MHIHVWTQIWPKSGLLILGKLKATSLQMDGVRFRPLLCLPDFLIYFQGRRTTPELSCSVINKKSIWLDWAVFFQMARVPLEVMVAAPEHSTGRLCFFFVERLAFHLLTSDLRFLFSPRENLEFSDNVCVRGHHTYRLPGWGITGNEAVRLLSYCKRRVKSLEVIYVAEFWSIKVNQIYFEDIHFFL